MSSDRLTLHAACKNFYASLIPITIGRTNLLFNREITVGIYDYGGIANLEYITVLPYTVLCVEKPRLVNVRH